MAREGNNNGEESGSAAARRREPGSTTVGPLSSSSSSSRPSSSLPRASVVEVVASPRVKADSGGAVELERQGRLLLSYLGNHMCTLAEAIMSILSVASHRCVMSVAATKDEHMCWSSVARFGNTPAIENSPNKCDDSSFYHSMSSHHGS
ncbi:Os08g0388400 [Oryza sativa Japonica Group]|uniref:Os08g0388400 protein n=1 Tax=Oryza sativa subsp. japonica TaxID=39947 RepID=A0A0N7KPT0_ORYSJ|nr:Os08g0388400 [Oryza sativa Japonica Group]